MDRVALLGRDISHSRSREIYKILSDLAEIELSYVLMDQAIDAKVWQHIKTQGFVGFNVTKPYKRTLFTQMDFTTLVAKESAAVNVIKCMPGGACYGHNTDQAGLLWDLERLEYLKNDPKILIIGAGGAVYNIMQGLASQTHQPIAVFNRTKAHAQVLAQHFSAVPIKVIADAADIKGFDLVIHASSSLGPFEDWLKGASLENALVYDLQYQTQTSFMRYALDHGAHGAHNGLGMLVAQAAYAMNFWYDSTLDPLTVLQGLKEN